MSKNQTMSVATTTPVPEVLQALEAKIKSLKRIEETPYKTNGEVGSPFSNIKNETKVENLIKAFASIQGRSKAYEDAAAELGLTTYPAFNVSGCNVEEWKHDIKLRMDIINYEEDLKKLKDYKTRMSQFLSQEDQKEMLIKEMQQFLGQ